MFPWLWVWAPQVHFPFSGSVAQQIDPSLFFDAIRPGAGDGDIERKAFDIASYGKQLGVITEVVLGLKGAMPTEQSAQALVQLQDIHTKIEAAKTQDATELVQSVSAQLDELRQHHPDSYLELINMRQATLKTG